MQRAGALRLEDLVLRGGIATGAAKTGGAVYVKGGLLTALRCDFSGNSADRRGGAVGVSNGAFDADHCAFSDNTVLLDQGFGGAVYASNAIVVADYCVFSDNYIQKDQKGTATGRK